MSRRKPAARSRRPKGQGGGATYVRGMQKLAFSQRLTVSERRVLERHRLEDGSLPVLRGWKMAAQLGVRA